MAWNPFGVSLEISATAGSVTRISATKFTAKITASWATYYSGAQTNYGMTASAGGGSVTLNQFGNKSSGSSGSFTGTFSIARESGGQTRIDVTFANFNTEKEERSTKTVSCWVAVPVWPSYTIKYDANGGSGAPSSQTKWHNEALTLSSTKPTRQGYTFNDWTANGIAYKPGASYTPNGNATLTARWNANTYTVTYNANGGSGAPSAQTKTHGVTLSLSSTKPTRANYIFKGWGTSASATTVSYAAGGSYTGNASITLYAIWELGYVKPRLSNFTVKRCDASGTAKDDGTYALVSFTWECDKTVSQILIKWKLATDAAYASSYQVSATGTSGTVSQVVGGGALASMSTYTIQATVTDSGGSAQNERTLNSLSFTMHGKPGGDGIAFGKTSELGKEESLSGSGVAEFAFDGKFNAPVYGKALGMDRLPAIPADSDLNNYMETGCYAVQSNAIAETVANIPVERAGRLEVWAATGEGVRLNQWSYLRQRFIPYNRENAVWEREITRGEDNVWRYYDWWQSSLTPKTAERVYNRSAISLSMTANATLGVVNSYTKIPFINLAHGAGSNFTYDTGFIITRATTETASYAVKVSGQVLVKCGSTAGNRHVRIQRVMANGTVKSLAWNTMTCTAQQNAVFSLAPIVAYLAPGEKLQMVFYTSDSADSIQSGSEANGWQTYFTAEEI